MKSNTKFFLWSRVSRYKLKTKTVENEEDKSNHRVEKLHKLCKTREIASLLPDGPDNKPSEGRARQHRKCNIRHRIHQGNWKSSKFWIFDFFFFCFTFSTFSYSPIPKWIKLLYLIEFCKQHPIITMWKKLRLANLLKMKNKLRNHSYSLPSSGLTPSPPLPSSPVENLRAPS